MNGRKGPRSRSAQEYIASLQRKRGTRTLKKRHLIVCEDGKSARAYFEALRSHFKLDATWVEIARGSHRTGPEQVVERAEALRKQAKLPANSTLPFAKVWCVIDGDYGPKIRPAREAAARHGLEIIVSTPCFEYWLLLHFEDTSKAAIHCDQLIANSLKKHIATYKKGSFNFESIVGHALKAADRARRHRAQGDDAPPENQNPCSEIYRLIDELRPWDDDVKKKA